jgi:hypothetical protein
MEGRVVMEVREKDRSSQLGQFTEAPTDTAAIPFRSRAVIEAAALNPAWLPGPQACPTNELAYVSVLRVQS